MRIFRKAFFIVNAVLLVLSACGNNTKAPVTADPATTTTASTVAPLGLVFTGKATGGPVVSIEFFDDYLEKVLNGSSYNNSVAGSEPFSLFHVLPFELKITSFYYYGSQVDVTCEKDIYAHRIEQAILQGSLPSGHTAIFSMGSDGVFYACDTDPVYGSADCNFPSDWAAQGAQDEITMIGMSPSNTQGILGLPVYQPDYNCTGSDGNDYIVGLGYYDLPHVQAPTYFNIKTGVYSGVVSVKKAGSLDNPINLFIGE